MKSKEIKIGRKKTNNVVLEYPQVSGNHAVIVPIGSNSLLIEDVGSTNGTYVNGIRIKRKIVSRTDRVKIANILFDISPYFINNKVQSQVVEQRNAQSLPDKEFEQHIKEEFKKLEEIWHTYQKIKINYKKKGFWTNLGLTAAGMGLGAIIGGFAVMAGSLIGRGMAGLLNNEEKLQAATNEFKINYTCPKCQTFLGDRPPEALKKMGNCPKCKVKWI